MQNVSSPVTGAYYDVDPSFAITSDATGGDYPILPQMGPFNRTLLGEDLLAVSSFGYWDIDSDDPININLTWASQDDIDGLTLSELDRLTIVGWADVSLSVGNIRSGSFLPSRYAVIAIGSLNCKRNFNPKIAEQFNPTACRSSDGFIRIEDLDLLTPYTINYVLDGDPRTTSISSDGQGQLSIAGLIAGSYTDIQIIDGVCSRRLTDFELIENEALDTDRDGITDCIEIDNSWDPLDPCVPNPLGNLNADCDDDGIINSVDCAPIILNVEAERICDDSEVQLTMNFSTEPWLGTQNVKFEWFDGDPGFTTPASANLLSTIQNPKLSVLPKSNNEFYVRTSIDGCPSPSQAFLEVNLIDLSPTDDQYDLEYDRDSIYVFDVLANDGLDISEIELYIIDQPSHGIITLNSDGTLSYASDGYFGDLDFIYAVCDPICTEICEEVEVSLSIVASICEFIPTGFSPNNDGMNDFLEIPCIDQFPGSSLKIFNRWGDLVYGTENYKNDWDGIYNGGLLPAGTYFYLLEVNDNIRKKLHGYIYIQY